MRHSRHYVACREDAAAQEVAAAEGRARPPVTKAMVFSMFSKGLDMLTTRLVGVKSLRLQGGLSLVQRANIVQQFRDDPKVRGWSSELLVLVCKAPAGPILGAARQHPVGLLAPEARSGCL